MHSISNETFLQEVFAGLPDDETFGVCAFTKDPGEQKFWTVRELDDPQINRLTNGTVPANNFFCISSLVRPWDQSQLRRNITDLGALYVLPLDDIGTKGEIPTLPPSYIIETSPDNYQWGYLLGAPEEDMAIAQALIYATSRNADSAAPIPNKLVRLPVGINNKAKYGDPAPECTLTLWEPQVLYSVEDLVEGLTDLSWDEFTELVKRFEKTAEPAKPEPGRLIEDEVFEWFERHDWLRSSEPDHKGFYQVTCPWAETHTTGDGSAAFSPLGCGGSDHRHFRQFSCLHDHCSDRSHVDLERRMLFERLVYSETTQSFHDMWRPGLTLRSRETLRIHFAPYRYRVNDTKFRDHVDDWIVNPQRLTVTDLEFYPDPSLKTGIRRDLLTGKKYLNTYEPYDVFGDETTAINLIEPICEQLQFLFGDQYENALGFLGHAVHKPQIRMPFALLHIAPNHGLGRGWLKQLMGKLVGPYMATADIASKSGFNEYLWRTTLVAFDEVYVKSARFDVGERLKEMITEPEIHVDVKHGYKGTQRIYCSLMFFSNHVDALSLPASDRRFWVVLNGEQPRPEEWYDKIYRLLDNHEAMRQFYWFLKRQMTAVSFNPHGRAPWTEAKREVISATLDDEFDMPIADEVRRLRALGVNAVWRSQLVLSCREAGATDLLDTGGGGRRRLNAVLRENKVRRHPTRLLVESGSSRKDSILFLGEPMDGTNAAAIREAAHDATQHMKLSMAPVASVKR